MLDQFWAGPAGTRPSAAQFLADRPHDRLFGVVDDRLSGVVLISHNQLLPPGRTMPGSSATTAVTTNELTCYDVVIRIDRQTIIAQARIE
jgi:hypothetical protein